MVASIGLSSVPPAAGATSVRPEAGRPAAATDRRDEDRFILPLLQVLAVAVNAVIRSRHVAESMADMVAVRERIAPSAALQSRTWHFRGIRLLSSSALVFERLMGCKCQRRGFPCVGIGHVQRDPPLQSRL